MSHPHGEPAAEFEVPAGPAAPAGPPAPVQPGVAEPTPTAAFPTAGPIPPGYAPVSAPAYPVSGLAYPVSAMPGYGLEPPKPKRTGTVVLSIATGVLALVAAGMTTLFFVEHAERGNADKKVAEQTTALTSEQTKAKDLETQLSTMKSDMQRLNQELDGAKGKTADVTKEKEAMAACLRAIDDYGRSQTSANRTKLQTACSEAYRYV